MVRFPQGAQSALDELLEKSGSLRDAAQGLSQRYRKAQDQGGEGKSLLMGKMDVLAYASSRMPATFAAISAALEQIKPCLSEEPASLLDVGAGPGTATLAALSVWPELSLCLVERDANMVALAEYLLRAEGKEATIQLSDMRSAHLQKADLVIAAYSLLELPDGELEKEALRLYELANQTLLLVEPGTPAGHRRLLRIRDALTEAGAHVAAPCPGLTKCPLTEEDWCAFSQRLQRTAQHRREKGGSLGFEDEKFSYLAFSKEEPTTVAARVRRHPRIYKGYVDLELCTKDGVCIRRIAKSSPLYKLARNANAGHAFPLK